MPKSGDIWWEHKKFLLPPKFVWWTPVGFSACYSAACSLAHPAPLSPSHCGVPELAWHSLHLTHSWHLPRVGISQSKFVLGTLCLSFGLLFQWLYRIQLSFYLKFCLVKQALWKFTILILFKNHILIELFDNFVYVCNVSWSKTFPHFPFQLCLDSLFQNIPSHPMFPSCLG